jgi:hypothetical protein
MISILALVMPVFLNVTDLDFDGIDDTFEQQLLVQYVPAFMISAGECDALPAEFAAGSRDPRATLKNGTIYGQVSRKGEQFEVHYYHLWDRDCGRNGHELDVEHVSVLVSPEQKALYWYAAAHEKTVCEASSGARAADLGAESRGATVWVSRGKHASYLSPGNCRLGCGVDECKDAAVMPLASLINIGESNAPMNGADWIASPQWPLAEKMNSDFSDSVIEQIENHRRTGPTSINEPIPPFQALILSGDSALDGAVTGNREAGSGVLRGLKESGEGVLRAGRALGRVLGIR